jgi:predicted Zn-dependent protease
MLGGTQVEDYGAIAKSLVNLSYDRDQESEADRHGVELVVKAGYDPSGLATFFARLKEKEPVNVPALLSTHPDPGDRAELIQRLKVKPATEKFPSPRGIKCSK